jgi:hypothetical protein
LFSKVGGHGQNRSKMTILKGGVDGFSYFALISAILFSNQEHPCRMTSRTNIKYQLKKTLYKVIFFTDNTTRQASIHWTRIKWRNNKWLTMFFLKRENFSQSSLIEGRSPEIERWLRNVLGF